MDPKFQAFATREYAIPASEIKREYQKIIDTMDLDIIREYAAVNAEFCDYADRWLMSTLYWHYDYEKMLECYDEMLGSCPFTYNGIDTFDKKTIAKYTTIPRKDRVIHRMKQRQNYDYDREILEAFNKDGIDGVIVLYRAYTDGDISGDQMWCHNDFVETMFRMHNISLLKAFAESGVCTSEMVKEHIRPTDNKQYNLDLLKHDLVPTNNFESFALSVYDLTYVESMTLNNTEVYRTSIGSIVKYLHSKGYKFDFLYAFNQTDEQDLVLWLIDYKEFNNRGLYSIIKHDFQEAFVKYVSKMPYWRNSDYIDIITSTKYRELAKSISPSFSYVDMFNSVKPCYFNSNIDVAFVRLCVEHEVEISGLFLNINHTFGNNYILREIFKYRPKYMEVLSKYINGSSNLSTIMAFVDSGCVFNQSIVDKLKTSHKPYLRRWALATYP